ncbi:hypothetical protein [Vibrio sp. SCSIO 43137]|uniref:hypothetical protein n=1 Tax=Vibrio sp. SCSIO 43137 TaxID=3021011 RepID=UPI002307D553|nr:hypothetical protein [Vibrio sp. SCSIO 43137]WCE30497.1 hypothetical protein PK654_04255 [Vibrio sp. SCSIO 43137]
MFIKASNDVLSRTCINLSRKITRIEYLNLGEVPSSGKGYALLYDRLLSRMPIEQKKEHITKLNKFVVVIYDDLNDENIGYTYPYVANRIALISMRAGIYTMEHELGHLALAGHEKEYSNKVNSGPRIAHAYSCGNYRSIMNENSSEGMLSGFYSDPNTLSGRQKCGDKIYANNSEQLRRWRGFLIRKIELQRKIRDL